MSFPYRKLITKSGSSFSIVHTIAPHLTTPNHYHPEYELVYMKKGNGIHFIGNYNGLFNEGCMVFVGRNVPQHWISSKKYHEIDSHHEVEGIVLNFSYTCLGNNFFSLPEMEFINCFLKNSCCAYLVKGATKQQLAKLLEKLLTLSGPDKIQIFISILSILSRSNNLKQLFQKKDFYTPAHPDKRIEKTLKFLGENYLRPIKLEEISSHAGMSASSFSRFFRQKTNQTIQSYLIDLRIRHAGKLLTYTQLPIETICFDSGFRNISHFNRIFKRIYSVCPSTFRKNYI